MRGSQARLGHVLGAASAGAIRASPCGLAIDSVVACALVVVTTASVAIAAVGAVRHDGSDEKSYDQKVKCLHCDEYSVR